MQLRQENGEFSPSAWLGGAALAITVAVIPFGVPRVPTVSAIIVATVFGLLAVICFLAAGKQHYLNIGRIQGVTSARAVAAPPEPSRREPPREPRQVPAIVSRPTVALVAVEANVAVMASRSAYRRLPADGKLGWVAVAAIRHKSGPNAVLTAHMVINGTLHAHAVPWIGSPSASYTLGHAQTAELILAVHTNYGHYYILDIGSAGLTHKEVPYGKHTAEVEIDVYGGETVRYSFGIDMTKDHAKMVATLVS